MSLSYFVDYKNLIIGNFKKVNNYYLMEYIDQCFGCRGFAIQNMAKLQIFGLQNLFVKVAKLDYQYHLQH
jgi:hypothetical protein